MKPLTRAEEEVMQVLWALKKALLKDVVAAMPEPKPHQNTVATILKILVEKEYVDIEKISRINLYFPLVNKRVYSERRIKSITKKYFNGSFSNLVSAMVKNNDVSLEELELLVKNLKNKK